MCFFLVAVDEPSRKPLDKEGTHKNSPRQVEARVLERARGTAAGCTPTDKIVSKAAGSTTDNKSSVLGNSPSLSEEATYESHGSPSISMTSHGDTCTFDSTFANENWRRGESSSNEGDELQTVGRIMDEVLGDDGRLRQEQMETAEGNEGSRDISGNTHPAQRPRKTQQTRS